MFYVYCNFVDYRMPEWLKYEIYSSSHPPPFLWYIYYMYLFWTISYDISKLDLQQISIRVRFNLLMRMFHRCSTGVNYFNKMT